ncbi:MAG: hypothetical protein LW875_02940 [Proteobacteria bacterium]|jgi:hypothetical protein|nr:hypothetical protein [Pseudomonadota bacterium]
MSTNWEDESHWLQQELKPVNVYTQLQDPKLRQQQSDFQIKNLLLATPQLPIFFVNIDYHSLESLGRNSDLISKRSAKIFLRFIGVHESLDDNQENVLHILKRYKNVFSSSCFVMRAETKSYARYLQQLSGLEFATLPYPPRSMEGFRNIENDGLQLAKMGLLGMPRREKGYFEFLKLFSVVSENNRKRIELFLQRMPSTHSEYAGEFENQLDSIKEINNIRENLSSEELQERISQLNLMFLFYDHVKYRLRGSAIFFDCMAKGIPCLTFDTIGFSNEVADFDLGYLIRSDFSNLNESIDHFFDRKTNFGFQSFRKYQYDCVRNLMNTTEL